jgi:transposase-like protein
METQSRTQSEDAQRVEELERENRELRQVNELLKAASVYSASEVDPGLRASRFF